MLTSTPGADAFGVVVAPPPPPRAKSNHHSRTSTTMTAITATINALLLLPSRFWTMTGPLKTSPQGAGWRHRCGSHLADRPHAGALAVTSAYPGATRVPRIQK